MAVGITDKRLNKLVELKIAGRYRKVPLWATKLEKALFEIFKWQRTETCDG